ncbi:divalent-cation tolerance protein CutA [bacterium]|nr:divalent-cation tolerance protein CutA [bacterium]
MTEYCTIMVTVPNNILATDIARALVQEKLAACVQILGPIRSFYRWQDKLCDDAELLVIIKTSLNKFEPIRDRIVTLHNYEVPEIIALPVIKGLDSYLGWIDTVTT